MRRRDFVVGLVLSATTKKAEAEQTSKVHRIAVVDPKRESYRTTEGYLRGFAAGWECHRCGSRPRIRVL
jgi:hypothetical protein